MGYISWKKKKSRIKDILTSFFILVFLVSIVGCEKDTSINSIVSNDGLQARLAYTEKGYTEIEVRPIVKTECYFSDWNKNVLTPVSGLFEYYDADGNWVASIDFGDSTCDEWATKTWNIDVFADYPSGTSTFSVFDYKKEKKKE